MKGLSTLGWLVVVLWGVGTAAPLLVPLSIAALLAFLMSPLVNFLVRRRFPEWAALVASLVLFLLPFAGIGYLLVQQGEALVDDFPAIFRSFNSTFDRLAATPLGRRLDLTSINLNEIMERVSASAGKGIALVVGGLAAILNMGSRLAIVLLFTVVMTASRGHLRLSAERILARTESLRGSALLDEVTSLIQRFLMARLLIVGIVGALSAAAVAIFGMPYSLVLGAFIGVMTLVPAVGFLIAMTPTMIISLATGHSVLSSLGMLGCLVAINILEGNVLTPKLVGNRLNLNALTTFLGLFAGGMLWGIWGMLLSIPILAVIRISLSASPSLKPWGDLMSDREDKGLAGRLRGLPRKAA